MSVRKSTVRKVKSYLEDLKEGCESSDITNLRKNADFYGLSGGCYSPILRAMGVVKKEGRAYVWNTGKPNKDLAAEVIQLVNQYSHASR